MKLVQIKSKISIKSYYSFTKCFCVGACVTLLLYKIDKNIGSLLKTLLTYLDYLYPDELNEIDEDDKIKNFIKGYKQLVEIEQ